jgi:hypothetical protein
MIGYARTRLVTGMDFFRNLKHVVREFSMLGRP